MNEVQKKQYNKGQVVFLAGSDETDLYFIESGKLMICVLKGSEVTPLSYLGPGEFLGELSFFDEQPRSATVIAIEDSVLSTIPSEARNTEFPKWLLSLAKSLTKKIRYSDELIRKRGIRKRQVESIKPLSIEEQTQYYQVIKRYQESKSN